MVHAQNEPDPNGQALTPVTALSPGIPVLFFSLALPITLCRQHPASALSSPTTSTYSPTLTSEYLDNLTFSSLAVPTATTSPPPRFCCYLFQACCPQARPSQRCIALNVPTDLGGGPAEMD